MRILEVRHPNILSFFNDVSFGRLIRLRVYSGGEVV